MFVWKNPLHGRGAPAYVNQMSMMPIYHEYIDAWLKNHIVPVIALNFITVTHERQMKKSLGRQVVAADDRGYGRRLSRVRGLTISANAGRACFTNPQTTGVDAPFYENLS